MQESIFDLGDRLTVLMFLEWQRSCLISHVRALNQQISDINHAIEWTRIGGQYGETKESKETK